MPDEPSGWDVIKPREQPAPPRWDVYHAPERAEAGERDRIRAQLESARNRFRDFLSILTDHQWPQGAPEIAAALIELESWPQPPSRLRLATSRLGLSRESAAARFDAAHRRLLLLLDETKDPLLAEKDFPAAAAAILARLDRVNRRLAGY
jgi:hypothetical protein